MRKSSPEDWLRDVDSRQRNTVFSDTAANEARFWRNIVSGEQKLKAIQVLGIIAVCAVLILPVRDIVRTLGRSVSAWLFLGFPGALFMLLRWRTRKALASRRTDQCPR
jgi:hypothetical protein